MHDWQHSREVKGPAQVGRLVVGSFDARWGTRISVRACVAVLVMLVVLPGMLVMPPEAGAATGRVAGGDVLNIRSCPALDCEVIGSAQLGEALELTGAVVNGFYPVRWEGRDAFAFAPYINPGSTAPWFVEGDVSCKRVALTFNIGIGYPPSQSVLDTLVQKSADATMFPMGWWAPTQPAYLRALDAAGFVIGTHGDRAIFLTDQTDARIRQDTLDSIAAIEAVIGRPIDPYHTPYAADTDNRVRTVVSDLGLMPVGWKVAAADWGTGVTDANVYSRVMNGIYPGAIVEFHLDGPATGQSTALALPRIIDDLRSQGYELVTVPELIIPCSTALPATPAYGTVVNTGGAGLRCRTAPSTSASIVTVLPEGARVPVRGLASDGWVPVTCGGLAGWVFAAYFRLDPVSTTPTPTPPPPTPPPATATYGIVSNTNGANLRCRDQPSTSGAIITLLAAGARVEVRGPSSNGWTPVVCASRNGFVSSTYLRLESGTPPTQPPTTFATVSNTGGDNLRCRTGPGTGYATITLMPPGTRVAVRGATQSGWVPIVCAGQNGWSSATYLTLGT